jgi:hypothetical protein
MIMMGAKIEALIYNKGEHMQDEVRDMLTDKITELKDNIDNHKWSTWAMEFIDSLPEDPRNLSVKQQDKILELHDQWSDS